MLILFVINPIMITSSRIYVYTWPYSNAIKNESNSSKNLTYETYQYSVDHISLVRTYCISRLHITHQLVCSPFFPFLLNRSCVYTTPPAPTYLVDELIKSRPFFVPTFSRPSSAQLALSGRLLITDPIR